MDRFIEWGYYPSKHKLDLSNMGIVLIKNLLAKSDMIKSPIIKPLMVLYRKALELKNSLIERIIINIHIELLITIR